MSHDEEMMRKCILVKNSVFWLGDEKTELKAGQVLVRWEEDFWERPGSNENAYRLDSDEYALFH